MMRTICGMAVLMLVIGLAAVEGGPKPVGGQRGGSWVGADPTYACNGTELEDSICPKAPGGVYNCDVGSYKAIKPTIVKNKLFDNDQKVCIKISGCKTIYSQKYITDDCTGPPP